MKSRILVYLIILLFKFHFTHLLTVQKVWLKTTVFSKWLKYILFDPLEQINFIELYNL